MLAPGDLQTQKVRLVPLTSIIGLTCHQPVHRVAFVSQAEMNGKLRSYINPTSAPGLILRSVFWE